MELKTKTRMKHKSKFRKRYILAVGMSKEIEEGECEEEAKLKLTKDYIDPIILVGEVLSLF